MTDLSAELDAARAAAVAAGAVIRRHYDAGPLAVDDKIDGSPVTRADLEANEVILAVLADRFPGDAVLSEESADDPARLNRSRLWIVDPLDGTRDFVARSGEFAVHVGLAIDGRAAAAAVYQPVGDRLYAAATGGGATVTSGGQTRALRVSQQRDPGAARIGVTRMAPSAALGRFLAETNAVARAVAIGASIKMLALAEGTVDATVCLHGREKEWDTCAPGLIVTEAGGQVTDLDGAELRYNRADVRLLRGILMSNRLVHDALLRQARPYLS
jgi:3'(2'), 5'-bisphosphate nucleotidase